MKALMATTVEPSPSAAIHAHPAGSKPRCSDPVVGADDREGRRGAGGDQGAEQEGVDAPDDAVGDEDVERVEDRGAEGEAHAERVQGARAAAGQHQGGAGGGQHERDDAAAVRALTADRDRDGEDQRGVGVEQQGRQRRIDVRQRAEEGARLRGVPDAAQGEADEDDAARRRSGGARARAPCGDDGPERSRGEGEAQREQGRDRDVAAVGLLGEDGHQPEADGGQEAESDASPVLLVVGSRGCARHGGCRRRSVELGGRERRRRS